MPQVLEKPENYYSPKNWPIFIIKGILWSLGHLPYPLLRSFAKNLGAFFNRFDSKNKRLILRNLELCFPDMPLQQRELITKHCLQSHILAAFETAMGWWGNKKRLRRMLTIKGEEHLHAAIKSGRGVMLITAHFTSLELQGVMISLLTRYSATAKHLKNPVADYEVNKARRLHLHNTLFAENLKQTIQLLKEGEVIVFLLDQDYGAKGSVFAPFFDVPTATTTSLARIAQKTKSVALPTFFYRTTKGFTLEFLAPLENYPSDDPVKDATQFNQLIETYVKQYPEQYGWTYKRFSTRPEGEADLY